MTNANHKRAARLLARERDISYTRALRLVRDERAYPEAWTYSVLPCTQDVNDVHAVITALVHEPEKRPFFGPAVGMLDRFAFIDFRWSDQARARYPLLRYADYSLVRQRVLLYEASEQLLWTAARDGHKGRSGLPADFNRAEDAIFNFEGREDLFPDLRQPPYVPAAWSSRFHPPRVPDIVEQMWDEGETLGDVLNALTWFVEDWPTSTAGWALLGEIHWEIAFGTGWQEPPEPDEQAEARADCRSAWQAGMTVGDTALMASDLPPGFAVPYRYPQNQPFLRCINGLMRLEWAEGNFDRALDLAKNLLMLDGTDPLRIRKISALLTREPYQPGDPNDDGPTRPWGDLLDAEDFAERDPRLATPHPELDGNR